MTKNRFAAVVGLLCALGGAVTWAVDLTVMEPWTEHLKGAPDGWAENNSYWARDLRFTAIAVAVLGLVLSVRGDRRWSWGAAGLGVVWVGADVLLDRNDVEGTAAAGWLSAGVVIALVATRVAVARLSAARSTASDRTSGRGALAAGSAIAGALVTASVFIVSPTDTERSLPWTALGLGGLLIVISLAGAAVVAPTMGARQWWIVGTVAVVAIASLAVARFIPGEVSYVTVVPFIPSVALLLGGAVLIEDLAAAGRDRWNLVVAAEVVVFGYPALFLIVAIATTFVVPVADPFTALVGNPAVNSADSDSLMTVAGVLVGLFFGLSRYRRLPGIS